MQKTFDQIQDSVWQEKVKWKVTGSSVFVETSLFGSVIFRCPIDARKFDVREPPLRKRSTFVWHSPRSRETFYLSNPTLISLLEKLGGGVSLSEIIWLVNLCRWEDWKLKVKDAALGRFRQFWHLGPFSPKFHRHTNVQTWHRLLWQGVSEPLPSPRWCSPFFQPKYLAFIN